MIKTEAIVVAEDVNSEETTAMKPMVARMMMMAIAITYPSTGRTVSRRLMHQSQPSTDDTYYYFVLFKAITIHIEYLVQIL